MAAVDLRLQAIDAASHQQGDGGHGGHEVHGGHGSHGWRLPQKQGHGGYEHINLTVIYSSNYRIDVGETRTEWAG